MKRLGFQEKFLRDQLSKSSLSNIYIACYDEVDSTMNVASEIAPQIGINNFALITSEYQSAGRGRNEHIWESPKNGNLYFTFLINVEELPKYVSSFSLIVGEVLLELIREQFKIDDTNLVLKWPNDILVEDGRKLSGILIETEKIPNGYTIMVGIGINFTDAPCLNSVALSQICNLDISKETFLAKIIQSLADAWHKFHNMGFAVYKDLWLQNCGFIGHQIEIYSANCVTKGKMVGINKVGALLLEVNGVVKEFYSGDVYTKV